MPISRRSLILGTPSLMLARRARAFGGGSALDPYILPRLPLYNGGYSDSAGRTLVLPSSLTGSKGVILSFGDSVSANNVNSQYTATQANNYNFNIFDGGLYKSVEPLLGCDYNVDGAVIAPNGSGCIYTRVADNLIANSVYANVVLVPIGLGGSLLADYAAGGAINGRFAPVKARLDAAGLTVTGIHCMLGTNDNKDGTSQSSATTSIQSIVSTIRGLWPSTPLLVATHTLYNLTVSTAIQTALQSVWNSGNAVYDGGDTDSITSSSDYWDNTHPNATGAAAMASLITTAISAHP